MGQQLETWLCSVEESTLPELQSFAKGIQQDKAAVLAGLTAITATRPPGVSLPTITATIHAFGTREEVVEAAFQANLAQGRPAI